MDNKYGSPLKKDGAIGYMNTKEKFNLLVSDINSLNDLNSPLEVLSKFNEIRYTLSILQDELVKASLDNLKVSN